MRTLRVATHLWRYLLRGPAAGGAQGGRGEQCRRDCAEVLAVGDVRAAHATAGADLDEAANVVTTRAAYAGDNLKNAALLALRALDIVSVGDLVTSSAGRLCALQRNVVLEPRPQGDQLPRLQCASAPDRRQRSA